MREREEKKERERERKRERERERERERWRESERITISGPEHAYKNMQNKIKISYILEHFFLLLIFKRDADLLQHPTSIEWLSLSLAIKKIYRT